MIATRTLDDGGGCAPHNSVPVEDLRCARSFWRVEKAALQAGERFLYCARLHSGGVTEFEIR
jgi:hypothetical protein